jgi:biotin carboxylase
MRSMLLVLGGNRMACEAIGELGKAGHRVLVMDANPEAPAREMASQFMPVNFFDAEKALQAIDGVDLSGVMSLNDFGVRTASLIAQKRGLPGYTPETAWAVTNKVAMKTAWKQCGLPTASFSWGWSRDIAAGVLPKWNRFPCVLKPAFSGGGSRGVYLVQEPQEFQVRVVDSRDCYLDDEVLIEEYLSGCSEHTVEVLVHHGHSTVLSISDKANYSGNVSIVQTLFFQGREGWRHARAIETLVGEGCRALNLTNGCAHFEVLVGGGKVFLLEVGGRPGGGLNFAPICRLSTGYNYPLELARVLTGERPLLDRENQKYVLGWHFFELPAGVLRRVHGFEGLKAHPAVVTAELFVSEGQRVSVMQNDLQRPGHFLVRGDTHNQVEKIMAELAEKVGFEIEGFGVVSGAIHSENVIGTDILRISTWALRKS